MDPAYHHGLIGPAATPANPSFGAFRSARFQTAMRLFPRARSAELLAVRSALRKLRLIGGTIVDAGGGNGYGSNGLQALFDRLIICDSSADMMINAAADLKVVAGLGNVSHVIGAGSVDFLLSQAAFHHIYVLTNDADPQQRVSSQQLDARVDVAGTRKLREAVWTDWLTALKPGGIGLVADVPPPDFTTRHEESKVPTSSGFTPSQVPRFFDEVVHPRSLLPHDRWWIAPSEIIPLLDRLGAKVIFQGWYPASWRFPSLEDAVFFVCELFALSTNAHQSPAEIERSLFCDLAAEINQRLGFVEHQGQTWMSWALYAICFEKCQ